MPSNNIIWCCHSKHEELLPDGRKRYCKTGLRPSYPKEKRTIGTDLANFINKKYQEISNGNAKELVEGDYFCTTCFKNESELLASHEENKIDNDEMIFDSSLNSPMNRELSRIEQDYAKMKLNQVFECMNVATINET